MTRYEAGEKAELIAFAYECARLGLSGNQRLVRRVSTDSTLGYDLESVESLEKLRPRFIEVKALGKTGEVMITQREIDVLSTLGNSAYIYLVDISSNVVAEVIKNPMKKCTSKIPMSFKVRLGKECNENPNHTMP